MLYDKNMFKLLPIGLVILAMVGVVGFLIISRQNQANKLTPAQSLEQLVKNKSIIVTPAPNQSDLERIKILEEVVTVLAQKVNITPAAGNTSFDDRVKTLEKTVQDLQSQVNGVSPTITQTAPQATKSPAYIPLGWVGSSTNTDWTSVSTQSFTFDPADYPGYSGVSFEVSLRAYQGNGQAFARLYNNDDNVSYSQSEISTSAQDYTWVSSSKFKLPGTKKTYILQLKSLTGYEAGLQNARLKVSF